MKKFLTRFSGPISLVLLALLLFTCGGGGGDGGSNSPLAGTSDILVFITGNEIGWVHYNVSIDGSGSITINSGTDSTGYSYFGPPIDIETRWEVDGFGTIREYDTSVNPNVINPSMYGHLASNNHFAVATDNDEFFSYSLIVARKRDASVTFGDGDIRGKSFAYHQIYGGPDNVWTYGFGSIDLLGRVTLDNAVEPSGELDGYPLVNLTTLSVDSAGIVTNPPDNDFYGWLTNDKNTIFALIDDPGGQTKYQFIAIQFLGHAYAPADLTGTWGWNVFYGWNTPGWITGEWTIDATGAATYDATKYLDNFGNTVPPVAPEVLTLAPDGIITNSAFPPPAYHGMLSAGGDMYVRTKTSGTDPNPRYSIAICVK